MKKFHRALAIVTTCVLASTMPLSAFGSEAAQAGDTTTEIAAESEYEETVEEEVVQEEASETVEESVEETVEEEQNTSNEDEPTSNSGEDNSESEDETEDVVYETTGECGEELTWEFIDGALYIKGTGEMDEYDEEKRPGWDVFKDQIEELHIEKEITLLDGDAFDGLTELETIYFGGSEADWESLEYTGEKEKQEVFSKVTQYYFEEIDEGNTGDQNEGETEDQNGDQTGTENGTKGGDAPEGAAATLAFVTEPADTSSPVGQKVTLHVEVNTTDVTYQWQWSATGETWKNCSSGGYNTDTFSFTMKETLNGRLYRCIVSNGSDEITSRAATISIEIPSGDLEITEQPEDTSAAVGDTVTLHVAANKEDATYQWQWSATGATWKNCTSGGYNTDTFSFVMKETLSGRQYRCVVSSGGDEVTSNAATISIGSTSGDLEITEQPADVEAAAGDTVTLHVAANKEDATYQWQWSAAGSSWKNCTSGGAKTDTFSFVMKETLSGRQYRCIVRSGDNEMISNAATITIGSPSGDLEITEQPEDVEAAAGATVTLHVVANKEDATYQWQWSATGETWKNCSSGGYNTDTFSFTMKDALNGRQYRCIVRSGNYEVISEAATISIGEPVSDLEITEQPEDVAAKAGDTVTLHVASNKENATYQWQWSATGTSWKNCTSSGGKTDTFSFVMKDSLNNRIYRCVVTFGGVSLPSNNAVVTLKAPEYIIDGVVYELIDDVMTVTGYTGTAQSVVVQETVEGHTVTVIGESAFEGNTTLQSIDLPDTIQVIKKRAFANCNNLTSMD